MPHDGVGSDLSLLDKKIDFGGKTHGPWISCFDE
jgi:hypothetical protein